MSQISTEDIEAYLDGTLAEADRQAFADRLAADADLRAEVALHRQLQETFADPGEVNLRATLRQIRAEGAGPPAAGSRRPPSRYWFLGGLAALLVLTYFLIPALPSPTDPAPAAAPPPGTVSALEDLIANPPDSPYDFELTAVIKREDGQHYLRLTGDLYANALPPDGTFLLEVYATDPDRFPTAPAHRTRVRPREMEEDGVVAFGRKRYFGVALNEAAPLPADRYYFVIREKPGDPVLYAGPVGRE